jgi:hypothetical protein
VKELDGWVPSGRARRGGGEGGDGEEPEAEAVPLSSRSLAGQL